MAKMRRTFVAMRIEASFMIAVLPCVAEDVAQNSVLAPGAQVQRLASDFEFTEGPTCDAEGNIFFTDDVKVVVQFAEA
jgi:hypothetical protein